MVVDSTAVVLHVLLQVMLFCSICAGIFYILCDESFCFAQKSQSRGKLNFLEIWLFFRLYLLRFQNSLRDVQSMHIWSSKDIQLCHIICMRKSVVSLL